MKQDDLLNGNLLVDFQFFSFYFVFFRVIAKRLPLRMLFGRPSCKTIADYWQSSGKCIGVCKRILASTWQPCNKFAMQCKKVLTAFWQIHQWVLATLCKQKLFDRGLLIPSDHQSKGIDYPLEELAIILDNPSSYLQKNDPINIQYLWKTWNLK